MGSPGNPNPHYDPHYLCWTMGTCFLALTSLPPRSPKDKKNTAFAHAYAQVYFMPLSVSLFIPVGSLFMVRGLGDQVSMVLCALYCTAVQRWALSLHTPLLSFSFLTPSLFLPLSL